MCEIDESNSWKESLAFFNAIPERLAKPLHYYDNDGFATVEWENGAEATLAICFYGNGKMFMLAKIGKSEESKRYEWAGKIHEEILDLVRKVLYYHETGRVLPYSSGAISRKGETDEAIIERR